MSLPSLPPELQDLIISNLHPTAAIALSKTNRHYHSIVSLHRLNPHTVREFLFDLERRSGKDSRTRKAFACYKCLCIKPGAQFKLLSILGDYKHEERYPQDWYDRECLDCAIQNGRTKPGVVFSIWPSLLFAEYKIIYIECLKAKRQFYKGCHTYACCLKGRRAEICAACGWCDVCVMLKTVEWESGEAYDHGNKGQEFEVMGAYRHHFLKNCNTSDSNRGPIICEKCLDRVGKFCHECRSCAHCLKRKSAEICEYCSRCDICAMFRLGELEGREMYHYGDGRPDFEADICKNHFPVSQEALDCASHKC